MKLDRDVAVQNPVRPPSGIRRAWLQLGDVGATVWPALALIVGLLLVRLGLAATMPFTVDEAYAVVVSRAHSLSYFDHPPIGFALARLAADIAGSENRFIVRLPYVLLGSLSALLLYDLTKMAYGRNAGFWAAAWHSIAPFFFISAGHFVVPDGPLDFFLLASVRVIAPVLITGDREAVLVRWIVSGAMLALALMSKYQAGLFCVSAALVLLLTRRGREELRHPGPWLAGLIASLGMLPAVIWNMDHQWASFAFQSGRAFQNSAHILHLDNFLITLVGQAGYVWPTSWIIIIVMVWRGTDGNASAADRFFSLLAAPPIVFFDIVALVSSHSLPHWSMSGFLFGFPLVGKWCRDNATQMPRALRRSFVIAVAAVPILAVAFTLQARTAAFTRLFFLRTPRHDLDWQSVDWSQLKTSESTTGLSVPGAFVIASDWIQGGKIGAEMGPNVPIEVLPGDPRHFRYMNDRRLSSRNRGFFIGAAEFGREDATVNRYRDRLRGQFEITGPEIWLVQDLFGFPDFRIVILPVRRL
ncbi:MAG: hypothetical protein BGN87_03245 [Rhizobiales bacterium 65-79]|nr:glycosyltransferase family 39 protein [Hyphomicrobiales bacterium]OJU04806.1 MAG: hypothetical protein BGN87_03245 [Rhizobiales bacterium 65-79]